MISIDLLSHYPEHIPALARLWQRLLGPVCGHHTPLHEIELWLQEWRNENKLPIAFVALADNIPVGICSLQVNDGIRPELKPWLGDLCVDPIYQGKGIAHMLITATKEQAKRLEFKSLYLYTFDATLPGYYQHLGWEVIGLEQSHNQPVTVMRIYL
ncbi:MAG: GNAT family N-acetyltransferase [Pseudomonadota bacterium]